MEQKVSRRKNLIMKVKSLNNVTQTSDQSYLSITVISDDLFCYCFLLSRKPLFKNNHWRFKNDRKYHYITK